MKSQLFPRHALPFFFALHWWFSIPRLIWFGQLLDPMKKNFFKILKNSQFEKFAKFCIKNHFFPRQAIPTTFLLCTLITLLILNTKFGLIWTTHWPAEKNLKYSKIRNSRNSQNSVWNPNFFLGTLYQFFFFAFSPTFFLVKLNKKYFLLYTVITMVILNAEFCLIWATPRPDEKQLILKFSKIRNSRNSQNSVWKPIFS